ncbi:hypothetical protein L596_025962 [Steinernema carpocapsae]|uniref:Uncharacterized protein n=1 Tax=Steinernema carpocapsae TaxID=34508 RepID=A0A4V5ZZ19_STECR|nr:hypothetical protein L596_025962 [Steinernema carpocapsae]
MTLITKRHNAVQTRLINAIPKKAGRIITSNVPIPGISSNRPDIVNGHSALHEAFERKVVKYEPEKKRLESQGYKVTLTAFVVGSLGTWFGRNSHCLKVLEVRRAYTRKMIPLMLSETPKLLSIQRTSSGSTSWLTNTRSLQTASSGSEALPSAHQHPGDGLQEAPEDLLNSRKRARSPTSPNRPRKKSTKCDNIPEPPDSLTPGSHQRAQG